MDIFPAAMNLSHATDLQPWLRIKLGKLSTFSSHRKVLKQFLVLYSDPFKIKLFIITFFLSYLYLLSFFSMHIPTLRDETYGQ